MKSHSVKYPFVREEVELIDEDGPYKTTTWRPGVSFESNDPYEPSCYANGEGLMILTVIGTYKPPGYPERTFYTRAWRDPDGNVFGKKGLRVTTTSNFKNILSGYRYSYVIDG